jgi:chromosome segregation ATPase
MPLTPDEIAAEMDRLSARFAVDLRRKETEVEAAAITLQKARAEIGEKLSIIHDRDVAIAQHVATIEGLEADLATARNDIAELSGTVDTLTRERDNLATTLDSARISAHAQEQEIATLRLQSDQRQGQIGELQLQVESLAARLADSVAVSTDLREDVQKRTEELRNATRALREAATEKQALDRRLAAAEMTAQDRTAALEALQGERLRLIEETGERTRERDHERVERTAAQSLVESLNRRVADLEAGLASTRATTQDTIADLTRTVEHLRAERRHADEELSALRFTKARLETDLSRLQRRLAAEDEAETVETEVRGEPAAPPQPRPT